MILRVSMIWLVLVTLCGIPTPSLAGTLFWATVRDSLRRAGIDGSHAMAIVELEDSSFGVAIDNSSGKIYWADEPTFLQSRIRRANLDGSMPETILSQNLGHVFGIGIDVEQGNIYWASNITNGVHRANLDGQNATRIVSSPGAVHLALDTQNQWIYWTDADDRMIRRVRFDGSLIDTLVVDADLNFGGALAVDAIHGYLYWAENKNPSSITRALLDASEPTEIVSGLDLRTGVGLAVAPECGLLYWTERITGRLMAADLDGNNQTVLFDQLTQPTGLAVTPDCMVAVQPQTWSAVRQRFR